MEAISSFLFHIHFRFSISQKNLFVNPIQKVKYWKFINNILGRWKLTYNKNISRQISKVGFRGK